MHSVDGLRRTSEPFSKVCNIEGVAAERDDDIGGLDGNIAIIAQASLSRNAPPPVCGRDEGDSSAAPETASAFEEEAIGAAAMFITA